MKTITLSATIAAIALSASAAFAGQAWVGQNHLNYRTGPGPSYQVAGTLDPCHRLDTYETQNGWVQILHQGQYYWVHGDWVIDYQCSWTPPKRKTGGGNY